MAQEKDHVVVSMTIAAPVDAVWAALRDPAQLANWFGWDAETLAEEITFIFADHAEEKRAAGILQFGAYQGVADRFELVAVEGGTLLRVMRSGPALEAGWCEVYEDMFEGWVSFVAQLRLLLEQHAGEQRRTIFLSGRRTEPGALPVAALGLGGLFEATPGTVAQVTEPLGVAGTLWHRSRHQVGLLVPDWGNGLLIVTDKPAPNGGPFGTGSVVLTTFGLSGPAFKALEAAWQAWWAPRFPPQEKAEG